MPFQNNAAPQRAGPKPMSSRLANMKRLHCPLLLAHPSENEPSSKRRKISQVEETPLKSQDESRRESLKPLGVNGAETMWTLDWSSSNAAPAAGMEDTSDDDGSLPWTDDGGMKKGRMQFGGFKKAAEKLNISPQDDGEEGEIPDDENNSDEPSSGPEDEARVLAKQNLARVRESRAQKAKAERDRSRKIVGERKKKEVRMNPRSKGISSGGAK